VGSNRGVDCLAGKRRRGKERGKGGGKGISPASTGSFERGKRKKPKKKTDPKKEGIETTKGGN